jgi:ABC-type glycerol-3-phosphate transport system permease component
MAFQGSGTTTAPTTPVATTTGLSAAGPAREPKAGSRSKVFAYLALAFVTFFSLFPLYWMLENSLRTQSDASNGVRLWPESFNWSNYSTMWNALTYPFHVFLINSFVMSALVTLGTVASCALVAYGFARFNFPGREIMFYFIIATTMIPYAVMLIPQYALFINVFHWGSGGQAFGYDNLFQFLPQIVPAFFGSPFFIFLLRQFVRGIPYDLDEAAKVDGAGYLRIFWTIILPELRPALAAVTVLTFIGKWNDFLGPLIYLTDSHNWTIELALNGFIGRYSTVFNLQMAASLMSMAPIVIVYFLASKQIIEGVTLSGVKG